jgi:uncharacterized protein (TIGR02145 family)
VEKLFSYHSGLYLIFYVRTPNDGATNDSGFTGLPGGYRYNYGGNYDNMGDGGYFWSSTESNSNDAWLRRLGCNNSAIGRNDYNKRNGFSVRCIRDLTIYPDGVGIENKFVPHLFVKKWGWGK